MSLVQTLVRKIKNELNALKVATPLNLGQLIFTDQTPSASYTGSFNTQSSSYVAARFAATFTRTDGVLLPPLVDFAYNYSVNPTYTEYMAGNGITITGNDPNVAAEFYVRGYEYSASGSSVIFYIDILNAIAPYSGASASVSVNVSALSTVEGTLTLTRLI